MNDNDDMVFVIMEDEEFATLDAPVVKKKPTKAEMIRKLWRGSKWDVCAMHANGRFYAVEVSAMNAVEARNYFVGKKLVDGLVNSWSMWTVRKLTKE